MEKELDYAQLWKGLKKRWLIIVCIPLVIAFSSGIYNFFILKPVYQASTTLIINKKVADSATQQAGPFYDQQLARTYGTIVKSHTVEQNVIKELHLELKLAELDQKITVNPKSTEVLEIDVTDKKPELAAQIANITAKEFSDAVIHTKKDIDISIIDTAVIPDAPVKNKKGNSVLIAFILGLMASIGLVFILEYLDNTIKTSKDVEEILGLTVLGEIPYYKG